MSPTKPIVLILPREVARFLPHFDYAKDRAIQWVEASSQTGEKPRIFYFDFDSKTWVEQSPH